MSGRQDRDQRFDEELRRAARALVTEDLPRGVLDPAVGASLGLRERPSPGGAVRARRNLPGFATSAVAVIVLLLATAVAFVPGSPGGPSPSPTAPVPTSTPLQTATPAPSVKTVLRSTAAIAADLTTLGYRCSAGRALETVGPGPDAAVRESAVCLPPDGVGPFQAAVIVEESASGAVVEAHVKADFTEGDTPVARDALAAVMAKAAAVLVVDGAGNDVGGWVKDLLPTLEPNLGDTGEIDGIALKLGRTSDGGYLLIITRAKSA